ncbi:extracellular solute-binding protein [Cellulomonas cellasea]|uniref:sugar ABC transporter substrate-binding protein n=1 Tax=Cellulomonas cellasea TaxID=43670 RepID=UPI0025A39156|nr:extracellular solute-binding protein [Cellulomonas cellasea]MDM8086128.1 extracellular solute-binding protein [Cellulomonas cellasea]
MRKTTIRSMGVLGAVTLAAVSLTACSSDGEAGGDAGSSYTWWDPYPQHDAASDWGKRVEACGVEAGVTVQRTAYDTTALTNQAMLSAQEGTSPDVILLDNPAVSTLADTGMLNTMEEFGFDTSAIDENLIAAGQIDGDTFGIPIGANTLALFYNQDVLTAAGVDTASITDWASLTDALAKVTSSGKKGITFAGIGTEEGSFQFLPWFWGAGADLRELDSPQAVAALELWTGWLADGYAPNSVISNSQNTTWEEFLTGDFGFVVNGTWQINSAAEADFATGVIPIPGQKGGSAAAPTGGEFVTMPVQKDEARYDTTRKIVECMTTTDGFVETGTTFAYYIPPTADGQAAILAENADLEPWVDAVNAAKGRTSDDLGTDYPKVSEQLWTAVQEALSGVETPEVALQQAQEAAEAAIG